MAFFEWSSDLDVHVTAMNDEHKKLIQLMNAVYDKSHHKAAKTEIKAALTALGNYTVQHFADEEKYMDSIKYAKLRTHKLIHEQLLTRFKEFVQAFDKGGDTLPDDFFLFLKNWLVAHIHGIDMQYGEAQK